MKRIVSILCFLFLIGSSFWLILRFADRAEMQKKEENLSGESVTVYTDMPAEMMRVLSTHFMQENKIKLNIVYVSSAQMLQNTGSEAEKPDVYLTSQEGLIRLKKAGKLSAYTSSQTDTILDLFKDEDSCWTGIWVDPTVFAVNQDFYFSHPAFSYTWNEVFSRKSVDLSMTDFIASDVSADLLMCLSEHFGIRETFSLLSSAQSHVVQYGKYLSTPSRMAAMSKCDIGISGLGEALRTQHENMPLFVVYPEDGSPWYLYGGGIAAGAVHSDNAHKLFDWLLSSYRLKKEMEEKQFYYIYVNDIDKTPPLNGFQLTFWELEKNYYEEGKKDLLNQWGEKVRFGGTER